MPKQKSFAYLVNNALLNWASDGNTKNRGFFIILCDGQKTHVAFRNLMKVSCDGSAMIGCDPDLAAAFETIQVSAEAATSDSCEDDAFIKAMNELPFDEETWRWISYDYKKEQSSIYLEQTKSRKEAHNESRTYARH